jgi:hypothetical protein
VQRREDMKKLSIGLILLFVFVLISCSKELSRDKAAEILSKGDYGCTEGIIPSQLDKNFHMGNAGDLHAYAAAGQEESKKWINENTEKLSKLKEKGFITYKIWNGPQGIRPPGQQPNPFWDTMDIFVQFQIEPTDKLKPYITGTDSQFHQFKVRLADIVFDKITGVKNQDKEAFVEFALKLKPTPLDGVVNGPDNPNLQLNRSAAFAKYDDGWRLVK